MSLESDLTNHISPHVDDPHLHPVHHQPLVLGQCRLLRQLRQRLPHHKHLRTLLPETRGNENHIEYRGQCPGSLPDFKLMELLVTDVVSDILYEEEDDRGGHIVKAPRLHQCSR